MTKLLAPDEIEDKICEIILTKNIPVKHFLNHYVTFSYPRGDGTPNVEVDEKGYHYVLSERGSEFERRTTLDIHELYYWVFQDITFEIASDFAVKNPSTWEQRRVRFKNQLEWLRCIDSDFTKRYLKEITEILERAPFDDGLPNNMDWESWEG